MKSLLVLLARRRGFRWLWLGETISLLGDWLSYVAVSLLALESGDGAWALALVFAAHILPTAFISPVAGIAADRFDKRRLLVGTQVAMAALMAAMVWAASARALWAVQALLVVRTTVGGFFHPAKQAALRALVEDEELVDANALDAATWSVTFTLGTALGGVIAMAGPVTALVVDGLTFVAAALVLVLLPELPSESRTSSRIHPSELLTALRTARSRPRLLEAVLTKAPLAVAGGGTWLLLNLTAEHVGLWGSAALALGALQAVRGIGTGVGPILSKKLVTRGLSAQRLLRISVWVSFLSMAAFTLTASVGAGLLALAVAALAWGMGGGGSWVFSATEMQRRSPRSVLGRLSSIDMLAFTLGQGMSAVLGAWVVDATGLLSAAGWLGVGLGVGLYAVLRLGLRRGAPTAPLTRPFAPAPPR